MEERERPGEGACHLQKSIRMRVEAVSFSSASMTVLTHHTSCPLSPGSVRLDADSGVAFLGCLPKRTKLSRSIPLF